MKKFITYLLSCVLLLSLAACASGNEASSSQSTTTEDTSTTETAAAKKTLIVYFSRADENYNVGTITEGNTYKVAMAIAKQIDADLFEIQPVTPYPADYDECTDVASKEQRDNARPKMQETIDVTPYETIYLGAPVWWGDLPMIVYTFLESGDFSHKTIHPFNTHEGSGASNFQKKIQKACPDATVTEVLSIRGKTAQNQPDEVKDAVTQWLKKH